MILFQFLIEVCQHLYFRVDACRFMAHLDHKNIFGISNTLLSLSSLESCGSPGEYSRYKKVDELMLTFYVNSATTLADIIHNLNLFMSVSLLPAKVCG